MARPDAAAAITDMLLEQIRKGKTP